MIEDDFDLISEAIARECASGVRGCCSEEQWQDLVFRIARAIQAERDEWAPRAKMGAV